MFLDTRKHSSMVHTTPLEAIHALVSLFTTKLHFQGTPPE